MKAPDVDRTTTMDPNGSDCRRLSELCVLGNLADLRVAM